MTGFRLSAGGAQQLFGIRPDMTTLGKILGAGLPVGPTAAEPTSCSTFSPVGRVYQAGTLSGNPMAMAAGIAMLDLIRQHNPYPRLEQLGAVLENGFRNAAAATNQPIWINRVGSMLTVFFTPQPVHDLATASASDTGKFSRWFHGLLNRGVYLPCSQFEAMFISAIHSDNDIANTLTAAQQAFAELK
jgi:glutamate-1-semialdehyde 2,1-aminomutase